MTELTGLEDTVFDIKVMDDGNTDLYHVSRAVMGALEFFRIGTEQNVDATHDEIAIGKAIIQCSMRAFALECALKGVLQTLGISFPREHDLSRLFAELPQEFQHDIEANWKEWTLAPESQGMTFKTFTERHKRDFVEWRYLKGGELESNALSLFAATRAVNSIYRTLD